MMLVLRILPYALTYVVLTDLGNAWNWLVGLLLGGAVAIVAGGWRSGSSAGDAARLLRLPWLFWGVAVSIVQGSWRMLLILLGRRPWRHVGVVTIRDAARTDEGLILLALSVSISPGSIVAEADGDTATLAVNVADARSVDDEKASVTRLYERYQRQSVP